MNRSKIAMANKLSYSISSPQLFGFKRALLDPAPPPAWRSLMIRIWFNTWNKFFSTYCLISTISIHEKKIILSTAKIHNGIKLRYFISHYLFNLCKQIKSYTLMLSKKTSFEIVISMFVYIFISICTHFDYSELGRFFFQLLSKYFK